MRDSRECGNNGEMVVIGHTFLCLIRLNELSIAGGVHHTNYPNKEALKCPK